MSHDALFQLGMGAVLLRASQKEESTDPRACKARMDRVWRPDRSFCFDFSRSQVPLRFAH